MGHDQRMMKCSVVRGGRQEGAEGKGEGEEVDDGVTAGRGGQKGRREEEEEEEEEEEAAARRRAQSQGGRRQRDTWPATRIALLSAHAVSSYSCERPATGPRQRAARPATRIG